MIVEGIEYPESRYFHSIHDTKLWHVSEYYNGYVFRLKEDEFLRRAVLVECLDSGRHFSTWSSENAEWTDKQELDKSLSIAECLAIALVLSRME